MGHPAAMDERGDILWSWLVRLCLVMAVLSLVTYEVVSVAVSTVALDDRAREVARAARDEYRVERSLERASATATEVARTHGAEVTAVTEDGDLLVIELEKQAPTLIVHRLGPLDELTTTTATSRIRWTP
jgi:hypothetical protein